MTRFAAIFNAERPGFPLWIPVILGLGVQIYFWAPTEPPVGALVAAVAGALALVLGLRHRLPAAAGLALVALLILAIGFAIAGTRARLVAAPILATQADAVVEGTIRAVGRTSSGRPRLVMDDLVIFGVPGEGTPHRAQVSLRGDEDLGDLGPGQRVSILAHVGPPGGPVEPGGFDYRRDAWFKSIGAVGYANGPPVRIPLDREPGLWRSAAIGLAAVRGRLAEGLRERLPGERGAFAAAVTVGERAGIPAEATEALRASNLAHLLAISGLHMGLVTALVFGGARLLLAAIPYTGRQWRTKKIAAVIALTAAISYLALSGASVATQRAFIMAAVALAAVLLDKPAITLRALATAATVILVLRPESLTHVGFQMSFAATAAIIAGMDFARERGWRARFDDETLRGRLATYVLALAATSLLAGLATAPFAAYHFNRVANYGLIANLAAVPIMGFWVAPSALIAAVLAPIGLDGFALWVMGEGIAAIMKVARFVASLDGATRPVSAAPPVVLVLIALGGLAMCLGRASLRPAGLAATAAGFAIWLAVDARPDVLIAPDGRLVGVRTETGRSLDHARSQSYAARTWLLADGDGVDQKTAAARGAFVKAYGGAEAKLDNGWRIFNVRKRKPDDDELALLCGPRALVIAPHARKTPDGPCVFFGADRLKSLGAVSMNLDGDALEMKSAAALSGRRLWTGFGETRVDRDVSAAFAALKAGAAPAQ